MKNTIDESEIDFTEEGRLRDLARTAVSYCTTQTSSRHYGKHVLIGTFANTSDKLVEQGRIARLTYDELSNLNVSERFSRFHDAFLNDISMSPMHSKFSELCESQKEKMAKFFEEYWIVEGKRIRSLIHP